MKDHELFEKLHDLRQALVAIAENTPLTLQDERYILVENDIWNPDNGEDPFLVIDSYDVLKLLEAVSALEKDRSAWRSAAQAMTPRGFRVYECGSS